MLTEMTQCMVIGIDIARNGGSNVMQCRGRILDGIRHSGIQSEGIRVGCCLFGAHAEILRS